MVIHLSKYIWHDIADFSYLRISLIKQSEDTNSPSTLFLGTLFSCRALTEAMLNKFNFLFKFYSVEDSVIFHALMFTTFPPLASSSDMF
uniref:Uncharacterized protein n=1 Tax=Ditylenchus dipsaci TaxID=166011 RepID=A0A915D5B2_9BILA